MTLYTVAARAHGRTVHYGTAAATPRDAAWNYFQMMQEAGGAQGLRVGFTVREALPEGAPQSQPSQPSPQTWRFRGERASLTASWRVVAVKRSRENPG